ncbi:hypothetical protein KGY64_03345 [Candidatus Bipolaricaulota bacterium]|nr:hypothetical protein [Candidatus Bipolaricaulota bacterium]
MGEQTRYVAYSPASDFHRGLLEEVNGIEEEVGYSAMTEVQGGSKALISS